MILPFRNEIYSGLKELSLLCWRTRNSAPCASLCNVEHLMELTLNQTVDI